MIHLDNYADSKTGRTKQNYELNRRLCKFYLWYQTLKLNELFVDVYGPYQVILNVYGIDIYTKHYVTTDSGRVTQIHHICICARCRWEEGRDTGAVVRALSNKTWERLRFRRSDLIFSNGRLVAAKCGAINVAGRTPKRVFQLCFLGLSFLRAEKLDISDQLVLGRDILRNSVVTNDLYSKLIPIG